MKELILVQKKIPPVRLEICQKKLHDQIFGPEILHTKKALIATIFAQKETA